MTPQSQPLLDEEREIIRTIWLDARCPSGQQAYLQYVEWCKQRNIEPKPWALVSQEIANIINLWRRQHHMGKLI